jgi:hypothetical protein
MMIFKEKTKTKKDLEKEQKFMRMTDEEKIKIIE